MSTRDRSETSAKLAGGRVLRLVRDEQPLDSAPSSSPEVAVDPEELAAEERRRSPRSLVRMMQAWSDAVDHDVALILES